MERILISVALILGVFRYLTLLNPNVSVYHRELHMYSNSSTRRVLCLGESQLSSANFVQYRSQPHVCDNPLVLWVLQHTCSHVGFSRPALLHDIGEIHMSLGKMRGRRGTIMRLIIKASNDNVQKLGLITSFIHTLGNQAQPPICIEAADKPGVADVLDTS